MQPMRPTSAALYPRPPGSPSVARKGVILGGSTPNIVSHSLSWVRLDLRLPPLPVARPLQPVVLDPLPASAFPDPWFDPGRRPRFSAPRRNFPSCSCPRTGTSAPPLHLVPRGCSAGSLPFDVMPLVGYASAPMRPDTRGRGGDLRSGSTPSFDVSLSGVADAPAQAAEYAASLLVQSFPRL